MKSPGAFVAHTVVRKWCLPWLQGSGQGEGHDMGMISVHVYRPEGNFQRRRKVSQSLRLFRTSADIVALRADEA